MKLLLLFSLVTFSLSAQQVAFECDPSGNSFIQIQTPPGSNLRLQSDFTIEFWLYIPSNAVTSIHVLNTNYNIQGSTFVRVHPVGTTSFDLYVNGNSGYNSFSSNPNSFSTGVWNHFAMSYTESTGGVSMYVNGVLDKTGTFPSPIPVNNQTSDIFLLANADNSTVTQSAILDDLRIWDGVRSAQEIGDNYNRCLTGLETNLLAYYDFEAESGSTVSDKAGNNNIGTIMNQNGGFANYVTSGLNCAAVNTANLQEVVFSIHPNPAEAYIAIKSSEKIDEIVIRNIQGQVLKQTVENEIRIDYFPSGIYTLTISTDSGVYTKRFVKK